MSVAAPAPRRCRRLRLSDQADVSSVVDLSARLTRQGGRARLTNVEFRFGDMTSSGYPDQSFDADRGADQSGQCHWLKENKVDRLETNAIYAIGRKPS